MTKDEILKEYDYILSVINISGIDEYKKMIEKDKDIIPMGVLTIASSIIAVFDMLEKKEKK